MQPLPTPIDFQLEVNHRKVPFSLWMPEKSLKDSNALVPLVLVGHGGSGHKKSQLVLDIAQILVGQYQIAVAAIDGPVHGDRREVFNDGPIVRQEFRDLWQSGTSIDTMLEDWQAAIDHLLKQPNIDSSKIAWYGISMGTAYGLPLVAADARIKASALGMWGTCRTPNERLIQDAKKMNTPVLFQTKLDDEIFTKEGQQELFNFIASEQKELRSYPGGHTDPKTTQLEDIVAFLTSQLKQ
ncbi:alpha/beta hydrolase [Polynucleobacter kasalickyi]|uniref:Dienelactone hydrolase family protein n=1 Tax=Polynucleobacter kasalickyi TaxID=1938817 RepID=A0A1W2BC92_9BURK|nr:dienelactone hydrolase family protein [Polynucleobacter kasalickyi]SMC69988.1 Dienelactone hydrolase family protein [Polynucleobacter kasalickyi]